MVWRRCRRKKVALAEVDIGALAGGHIAVEGRNGTERRVIIIIIINTLFPPDKSDQINGDIQLMERTKQKHNSSYYIFIQI